MVDMVRSWRIITGVYWAFTMPCVDLADGKNGIPSLFLPVVQSFLYLVEKPADMEAIAHSVVYLNGNGQQSASILAAKLPHGKDGQQIIVSLLQIQLEAGKITLGNHGDRERVSRTIRLCVHPVNVAIMLEILLIRL